MTLNELFKKGLKFTSDNSPTILTIAAVTGTLTTAYLTGKASFKAAQVLADAQILPEIGKNPVDAPRTRDPLEPKEKFNLVWKFYIPAASTATASIVCIILANRISDRRTAALAAAYVISGKAFDEYKNKVIDNLGKKKEQDLRDELAQDRVKSTFDRNNNLVLMDGRSVLCLDSFTGRYFINDMETLRRAQNDINHEINTCHYASLTDFYDRIGLPRTSMSDEFGWNGDSLLELRFSTTMTEDGRPCIVIDFTVFPVRNYHRIQ